MAMTFSQVAIDQSGAGTTVLLAAAGGKTRLWYLVGALASAGTIQIQNTGGGGLTGNIPLAANTPFEFDAGEDIEKAIVSPNAGIQLVSTGGAFDGYAVLSSGDPGATPP